LMLPRSAPAPVDPALAFDMRLVVSRFLLKMPPFVPLPGFDFLLGLVTSDGTLILALITLRWSISEPTSFFSLFESSSLFLELGLSYALSFLLRSTILLEGGGLIRMSSSFFSSSTSASFFSSSSCCLTLADSASS